MEPDGYRIKYLNKQAPPEYNLEAGASEQDIRPVSEQD